MSKTTKKEKEPTETKPKKKDTKKKEPSVSLQTRVAAGRVFFKESWGEFKKIQWPTPRQAMNESLIVVVTVFFVILLVALYDWISSLLLNLILVK